MKKTFLFIGFFVQLFSAKAQNDLYINYPVYRGTDLGLNFSILESKFRIWSPKAEKAELIFYSEGVGGYPLQTIEMKKSNDGTWAVTVKGDQKGRFYVFRVQINGKWLNEIPDPYAKSVGVNGIRAMVVNLKETDPVGWNKDKSPEFKNATDAIIYELHVRDASIAENSGIKNKGKFLGLTETGTKSPDGLSTGLDHLKELGVTHIHLLPCFDFNSIDEAKADKPQYNWGYDPLNYNVPEGSYSTNPYDGVTRIKEFKQLIKTFHENGLRVIMDVVYNHTALTENSYFNQLVPGYYYRQNADGKFSNATGCGNEVASEREMVRKFILESLMYWVKEYHVDGFRFDLMGVHDIKTMNLISKELYKLKPSILLYGEGWTSGSSPLPDSLQAIKKYAYKLNRIGVFSDDIRDGIKGSVFEPKDKGFVSGKSGLEETIKFGVVASCKHPQVDYTKVNYSKASYAAQPNNTITYCECHDNNTLWDKLSLSATGANEEQRKEMQKLALSIVLTSQGIPFLHAGTEFLRSKKGVENSFQSPDSINEIDWSLKAKNKDVLDYVKALIKLRKEHPAFRLTTAKDISSRIKFLNETPGIVAYSIDGKNMNDRWNNILVIYNGNANSETIHLPGKEWQQFSLPGQPKNQYKIKQTIDVTAYGCTILYQ